MKITIIILIIIILFAIYSLYETFQLKVRKILHVNVSLGLDLKAVVITDLHNKKLYKRDIESIVREKPDCVFVAGDVLTGSEMSCKNALDAIISLCQISDVYFSYGNHELKFMELNPSLWEEFINRLPENCFILDDSHRSLNENVEIFGISLNRGCYKRGRIHDMSSEPLEVFKDIPSDKKKILLAHNPDFHDYYEKVLNPDFIISGHLHGGFVRLPVIGGLIHSCYGIKHRDKGLYEGKHYVSSGAGEHLLPLRFLNRCEIVVLVFSTT